MVRCGFMPMLTEGTNGSLVWRLSISPIPTLVLGTLSSWRSFSEQVWIPSRPTLERGFLIWISNGMTRVIHGRCTSESSLLHYGMPLMLATMLKSTTRSCSIRSNGYMAMIKLRFSLDQPRPEVKDSLFIGEETVKVHLKRWQRHFVVDSVWPVQDSDSGRMILVDSRVIHLKRSSVVGWLWVSFRVIQDYMVRRLIGFHGTTVIRQWPSLLEWSRRNYDSCRISSRRLSRLPPRVFPS